MDAIQPSHPVLSFSSHLQSFPASGSFPTSDPTISSCPLLLLPSIFPSIKVFSYESLLGIRWLKYWSFSFSPYNEYSGLISFRRQRTRRLDDVTNSMDMSFSKLWEVVKDREAWRAAVHSMGWQNTGHDWATKQQAPLSTRLRAGTLSNKVCCQKKKSENNWIHFKSIRAEIMTYSLLNPPNCVACKICATKHLLHEWRSWGLKDHLQDCEHRDVLCVVWVWRLVRH